MNGNVKRSRGSARFGQPSPYAVVFLPSLLEGALLNEDLRLPLTLAYLLSPHIAFRLPMSTANMARVERTFDEIIPSCLQLGKSKGISYVTVILGDVDSLLESSVFVLTDEQGFHRTRSLARIPQAVVMRPGEDRYLLWVGGAKRLRHEGLKVKLIGSALSLKVPCRAFSAGKRLLRTA